MIYKTLLTCALIFGTSAFANSPDTSSSYQLAPTDFSELIGWSNRQALATRPTLLNSCKKITPKALAASPLPMGSFAQWKTICNKLAEINPKEVKQFFESHFNVYQVSPESKGLFTGYYSPVYNGRLQKEPGFEVPLLKKPTNTHPVKINDTRRIIEEKIRSGMVSPDHVVAWIKSPIDKFFLQVQGSGNIQLKNGNILHVAYAGDNAKPYVAIGKILKNSGALEKVTMRSVKNWLRQNPEEQQPLFNKNPRYIFFRKSNVGAVTAQGVPASPQRTLAVDPSYIPYGTPVWLDTTLSLSRRPYYQMMVAQDTGSAIKGPVRGDIYMGVGEHAATLAGPQQAAGSLYVMLPKP